MKKSLIPVKITILFTLIALSYIYGCSISTTGKTEKSRINYSKPYYGDNYVAVIYNEKITTDKNDAWAKIIYTGLEYAADYAKSSDELGVGITYTDGSGSYFYVSNFYMIQFKEKEITWDEFITFIKTKDFPLNKKK